MLRVFPGVERSAGCGHAHGVSKRGKRHGMKWGARQEEIPAPFSITGLAMSFRTQHPADRILSVCLQKRMLCARLKTGVAPVDLFLDLFGHGAVLLLQQMPGASHHTQPF